MRKFLALLRVNFQSLLVNTFSMGRNRKKAASGKAAFAILAILMLYMSGVYSFALASDFAALGAQDIVLTLMLLFALIMPFFFTIYFAQSLVFSTKDMDLVFSLPVSHFSVMLSRVMALYLENVLMVEFLLLPAGIAYIWYGGPNSAVTIPALLVLGLFWALLPTLAGMVLGCVVSVVISRLRFKNLFTVLLSLLLVGGIFVGSMFLSSSGGEEMLANVADLRTMLGGVFPPAAWFTAAATGQSALQGLLVVVISLVPFLVITWLFSLFFKPLLGRLSSTRLRANFKLQGVGASSRMGALLKKEVGRFFGTPAYILNCGIMMVMVIAFSIYAALQRDMFMMLAVQMSGEISGLADRIFPALVLAVAASTTMMTNPAAVSISLEGRYLWILKEAPLGAGRIFAAKAGFNFLLTGFGATVCTLLLGIAFGVAPLLIVCILLVALLYAATSSCINLFINLLLPRMDAVNDTVVIKQSASVIVAMLANVVLAGIFVGLFFLVGASFPVFLALSALLLAAIATLFILLLNTKGRKLFAAIT